MTESSKKKIWNFVDNLGGDKVVWIITLLLVMFSIVCIFSSSSRLLKEDMTRLDIAKDQIQTVLMGMGALIICYNIRNVEVFRWCSQWGAALSLILLLMLLVLPTDQEATIHAGYTNGAIRSIVIKGKQFHIFEVVKVAMVLYCAWFIDKEKREGEMDIKKKILLLYAPVLLTLGLVVKGSNSSAIFIGGILILTVGIGQGKIKDAGILAISCIVGGMLYLGISTHIKDKNANTSEPDRDRTETFFSRLRRTDHEALYLKYHRQSDLDALRQPYSARLAIHDSRVIGKGPGQSTQRYVVPDMPEDYMYSFIVEEYGIAGGLLIIILYTSLMARGVLIVKNCGNNTYAKVAIAGLILMICGQAFMHIFVNASFGLLTGQTLPLLSHGASAFLCFSVAFGIILSISRVANKNLEKETKQEISLQENGIQSAQSDN